MTTGDAAMSLYLNINQNSKGKPNENYAREFMELFCLGPKGAGRHANYTQADVAGLAQAFTGWVYNSTTTSPDYGKMSFTPSRFEMAAKSCSRAPLRVSRPSPARRTRRPTRPRCNWGPAAVNPAVDTVLAHANHAQFLIRKLWAEFIASPIPQATLDSLVAAYRANGYQLKPLMRGDPDAPADLRVDRRAEPDQAADRLHRRRAARSSTRR